MLKKTTPLFITTIFWGGMLVLPWFTNDFILSLLILSLYFAYLGQAWNLMMGFAGQLSLGHALYVGLGAYISAGLFFHYGLSPWLTLVLSVSVSALLGAFIAFLGLRFAIKGVYFSLLTIAFAEFARILFDHLSWFGGSGGLFLPVSSHTTVDFLYLRGRPALFYYVLLVLVMVNFLLCRLLLKTRLGYYWLALREDPEAAQSLGINLFYTKLMAVSLSAGLTAIGGVIYAFYQNSLFPEQVFAMSQSIELLMGSIVGGVGTLFGPIIGALLLTPMGEFFAALAACIGLNIPGLKHLFYGSAMLLIMLFMPQGVWPCIKKYIVKEDDYVL